MEKKETHFTILMFPWLAHGHVFPYLQLSRHLSSKNFNIYFCSTPVNLSSIKDGIEKSGSINLVELHLPPSPELPVEYHTTKNVPPDLMPKLFEAFAKSRSSFSAIVASLKPDLVIYDVFQPWAATIALSLGIPAVHFATSGAAAYSYYYHRFRHQDSPFPYEAIYLREHERRAIQAMNLRDKMDQDSPFGHFKLSCGIVLMKTCRGIEGKYIDYLSILCNKKMVPVGPLVSEAKTEEHDCSEIIEWLGKNPPSSTVFISFGSENYLSKEQTGEIAKGLESCDVNFIWVIRFPLGKKVSLDEMFPEGFLGRVEQRGVIVQGWAPQAKILAHPSTGGFVSHCGFSSTIESIYFGVPLIGIPLKLDQPLNARLAVEASVGVEVERDGDGLFTGEDVANAISKVIIEKTGEDMRAKAAKLSKMMKNEEEDIVNEAVEQLRRICMEHEKQEG